MAAAKAKQFLECAYRIDSASPTLVATSNDLFELKKEIKPKELPDFKSGVEISENSAERSTKLSTNFGIEGDYYAFSGAAEASLDHYQASKTKTIRADHDLYAIKFVCHSNVLNYSDVLRDDVVKFVKKASVEKICKKLGHFYATEVTLGGHLQLTRIIKARSEDTADSMSAAIKASYGKALVGSVKANASASAEFNTALEGREESCDLSVQGGDVKHWLAFDGSDESKTTCQVAWAAGIEDSALYPLKMQLSPIWEALSEHEELGAKATELKKYLLSKWKADFDRVAALKKAAMKPKPMTEAEGKAIARRLGLALGGKGTAFSGDYSTKGLYSYKSGKYKGIAFFGTGGTFADQQKSEGWSKDIYRPK